jgi:hypothetical protein
LRSRDFSWGLFYSVKFDRKFEYSKLEVVRFSIFHPKNINDAFRTLRLAFGGKQKADGGEESVKSPERRRVAKAPKSNAKGDNNLSRRRIID